VGNIKQVKENNKIARNYSVKNWRPGKLKIEFMSQSLA
jgi:hypothetical protein